MVRGYYPRPPLEERFWSKVDKRGPDDCWNWTASTRDGEYGSIWVAGSNRFAHRVAYEMAKGEIGPDLCVCHSCDNPRCVNPTHLWLGTNAENTADRNRKGRQGRTIGEAVKTARLTDERVRAIRTIREAENLSHRQIAEKFGVSPTTIARVLRGECWSHI